MIFVHDHTFINYKGNLYTLGTLNNNLFSRYLQVFDTVTVVANYIQKEELSDNGKLVNNVTFHVNCKPNNPFDLYKNIRNSAKFIEKESEQPVIIRIPSFLGSFIGLFLIRKKRPFFVEVVGDPYEILKNRNLTGKILAAFMMLVSKFVISRAQHVLYVTKQYLSNKYPTRGKSVCCSDVLLSNYEYCDKSFYRDLIIGTAGSIDLRYKGQADVIKAISRLKRRGINCKYILAGAGDKKRLQLIARKYGVEENVEFWGYLDSEGMKRFYSAITYYIQPSYTEGLPRTVVEALAAGCLAMGSNVGGIPELINPKVLFNPGNVAEITDILSKMNSNLFIELLSEEKKVIDIFLRENNDQIWVDFYQDFKDSYARKKNKDAN